jgi:hypothetical protein
MNTCYNQSHFFTPYSPIHLADHSLTHWRRKMLLLYVDQCPSRYCVVTHSFTHITTLFFRSLIYSLTEVVFISLVHTEKSYLRYCVVTHLFTHITETSLFSLRTSSQICRWKEQRYIKNSERLKRRDMFNRSLSHWSSYCT